MIWDDVLADEDLKSCCVQEVELKLVGVRSKPEISRGYEVFSPKAVLTRP